MKITAVKKGSTADSIGVKPGDRLLRINSKRIKDEIDFSLFVLRASGYIASLDVKMTTYINNIYI